MRTLLTVAGITAAMALGAGQAAADPLELSTDNQVAAPVATTTTGGGISSALNCVLVACGPFTPWGN
ncbi:hypothetical protein ACFYUD_01990 [Nocardia tengchongensis]|uniref:hypothetical protein n=1 Tax=Nocardia tengchongensis TaxID=2055889 RepID=UPI003690961A